MSCSFVFTYRSCLFRVVLFSSLLLSIAAAAQSRRMEFGGDSLGIPGTPEDNSTGLDVFASRGTLSGAVQTEDKHPISNARIVIIDMSSGRSVATLYTGGSGRFEVRNLPRGNYEIVAENGLSQARAQVHTAEMSMDVTLRLPRTATDPLHPGQQTVSVQSMSVPEKAKRALQKARESNAKGKLDEARHEIAKALEIAPNFSDAVSLRGMLSFQSGDVASAENDLQKAIQLDNNNALAYIAMGVIYNLKHQFDDALRTLDRGAALDPRAWQAHFEISKAQLHKGMLRECLAEVEKASSLLGHDYSPMRLVRGQALFGIGSYSEAASEFQKYLDENKNRPGTDAVKKALEQALMASASRDYNISAAVRK